LFEGIGQGPKGSAKTRKTYPAQKKQCTTKGETLQMVYLHGLE
jgi:hypothetical protein